MVKSRRDLRVWQAGMDLSVAVYNATKTFPKSEVFGLIRHGERRAASIRRRRTAIIAEG